MTTMSDVSLFILAVGVGLSFGVLCVGAAIMVVVKIARWMDL